MIETLRLTGKNTTDGQRFDKKTETKILILFFRQIIRKIAKLRAKYSTLFGQFSQERNSATFLINSQFRQNSGIFVSNLTLLLHN